VLFRLHFFFILSIYVCDSFLSLEGALTEENLLFLEAWRTIDRAYIDKNFNGQSWFRYRENALRNEPMNNREETCMTFTFYLLLFFYQLAEQKQFYGKLSLF
jgi:hypothetical protein